MDVSSGANKFDVEIEPESNNDELIDGRPHGTVSGVTLNNETE